MKLSIVVPVFNAEKTLEACLTSILEQDLKDWECFLINDGSTDRSSHICETFAVKDSRFKVVHKYNEGPAVTRNLGIYLAQGDWLGFVDADDWIEPNRFSSSIDYAEQNNLQVIQCGVNVYKNGLFCKRWKLGPEDGIYKIGSPFFTDPLYDIGHCWDKVYKTSLIKDNQIKFAKCDMCEDTFFNIHVLCKTGYIYSLTNPVYNYNIQKNTLSHSILKDDRKISIIQSLDASTSKLSKLENFEIISKDVAKFFEKILSRPDQIDYVFPYVDCSKRSWQNQYSQYCKNPIDTQRFDAHENLLKYKLRAIEKWMPWIGTIHMLVSDMDQVPSWINTNKVHIVCHKDFIPQEYLPTFNSCTIEMFLHKIPGLSEKFIYGNDDMYANDILKPKFFFPEENKLKADLHIRKLWHEGDINKEWAQIPINCLKLAAKDKPEYLAKYVDGEHLYELQHIDKPMFKSINSLVFDLYNKEILDSITRFRDAKNFNQYLFIEYALFHGYGVFETFRFKYFQIGNDTSKILESLSTLVNRPREICCNEAENSKEEDFVKIEKAFLELYGQKSKYEGEK